MSRTGGADGAPGGQNARAHRGWPACLEQRFIRIAALDGVVEWLGLCVVIGRAWGGKGV